MDLHNFNFSSNYHVLDFKNAVFLLPHGGTTSADKQRFLTSVVSKGLQLCKASRK